MATVISLDTDSEDDKEVKVVQECNVDLRESIVADDEAEGSTATIRSMAEYEIEDDAYRGILSSAPSPWKNCQLSEEAISESSRVRCWNCPSLRAWTEEAETALRRKKKKKKGSTPHPEQSKSVLGRRPMNHTFQCQCDFNPVRYHFLFVSITNLHLDAVLPLVLGRGYGYSSSAGGRGGS